MMQLDTRRPVLVMLGAWNPAIFTPPWVAYHLLDIPVGKQVTVRGLLETNRDQQIIYIGDIGYCVTQDRLEIYSQTLEEHGLKNVLNFLGKILDVLPHTPMGDYGVNFHFVVNDPPDSLTMLLKSQENLDERFTTISNEHRSKIAYSNTCELNFYRFTDYSVVMFSFNYHNVVSDKNELRKLTSDYLKSLLDDSSDILKEFYELGLVDKRDPEFC